MVVDRQKRADLNRSEGHPFLMPQQRLSFSRRTSPGSWCRSISLVMYGTKSFQDGWEGCQASAKALPKTPVCARLATGKSEVQLRGRDGRSTQDSRVLSRADSPWRYGMSQNTHGLLCQYLSPGPDLSDYPQRKLNTRPRAGLDFSTLWEAYAPLRLHSPVAFGI